MRGHAAAGREDGFRSPHSFHVLGIGLFADQDDILAFFAPVNGVGGGENYHAARAAGARGKAFAQGLGNKFGFRVYYRV